MEPVETALTTIDHHKIKEVAFKISATKDKYLILKESAKCVLITPEQLANFSVAKNSVDSDKKFCRMVNVNHVSPIMSPPKTRPHVLCQSVIRCRNYLVKDFVHIVLYIKPSHLMAKIASKSNATINKVSLSKEHAKIAHLAINHQKMANFAKRSNKI